MYPISPVMSYGMCDPYMMGMGMYPQNLQQYKNMQGLSNDLRVSQVNFMGKVNPFFSVSKDDRLSFLKGFGNRQAEMSSIFSPYSDQNIGRTRQMMTSMNDCQMSMMMANPFALGCGPVMF